MYQPQSLDVYDNYFGEGGCFLPRNAIFHEVGGAFTLYDEILDSSSQWYMSSDNTLRKEFDRAFLKLPRSWQTELDIFSEIKMEKLFSKVTMLCHLYRWGSLPAPEKEYSRKSINLPLGLKDMLSYLSVKMSRPPCGSLWSTTVSNYQTTLAKSGEKIDFQNLSVDNIEILHSWFTGYPKGQLENWIKVFVLSEAEGLNVITIVLGLIRSCSRNDSNQIVERLDDLCLSIKNLTKIFTRLTNPRYLDKNLWREVIQPTFIWGLEHQGKNLQGASGLQLGANQVIDLILGVSFNSKIGQAIIESRLYMPLHHQKFLFALQRDSYIFREKIKATGNPDIHRSFDNCIECLSRLRRAHMQVGKVFIKGDGTDKKITTTGLSMNLENNPVDEFETDMGERIIETNNGKLL